MIALAILSCWLRISIFPRFYLGTVLKPTVIHTMCLLYTHTVLNCLSACTSLSLSVSLFHSLLVEIDELYMDRLMSVRTLLLKMSGRSLGSRQLAFQPQQVRIS